MPEPHTSIQAAMDSSVTNDRLFPSETFCFFSGERCPGVNAHVFALPFWSLGTYCKPGPVLGAWDLAINKMAQSSLSFRLSHSTGVADNKWLVSYIEF